jgi:hypothetical protein
MSVALAAIVVISAVFIGAVLALHRFKGMPFGALSQDPASVTGCAVYTGFLSNIGILLWSATAALCLFAARIRPWRGASPWRPFLLVSGVLTLALTLDDLFLLHDEHGILAGLIGTHQSVAHGIYLGVVVLYLLCFRRVILQTEYPLLIMALLFFALSIASDLFLTGAGFASFMLEDGAKFIGLAAWFVYFARVAAGSVKAGPRPEPKERAA